ncbi:MAG: alpha/beta hydrolase [Pseudomonadota bacterium]
MVSKRVTLIALIILLVSGLWFVFAPTEEDASWSPAQFRDQPHEVRDLQLLEGETVQVFRGKVSVPEVRSKHNSRAIQIGYAVVEGAPGSGDIPVVLLAGGPGGSHIRSLDRHWVKERIALFRQIGDVIMVDLRGIHTSQPGFELSGIDDPWRAIHSHGDMLTMLKDVGVAGRASLEKDGFDVDGYVITEAAADVVDVADHLNYPRINLQGTSFGSHFTFAVVRGFPERVNRFMVTGVEGYDHTFDDGVAVRAAVAQIAEEAKGVWSQSHGFPDPLTAFEDLLVRSKSDPEHAFGFAPNELELVFLNGSMLGFDYGLSSREGMQTWPQDVAAILEGEGSGRLPLIRRLGGFFVGREPSDAAVGLFDCSSWISDRRAQQLRDTAPPHFPDNLQTMEAMCSGWNVPRLPEAFQLGETSAVPGLFVHGTYDVSTPYQNALETLPFFPNAHLVTVKGGSHNVLSEMLEASPEFSTHVQDWFNGGDPPADFSLPPLSFVPLTP